MAIFPKISKIWSNFDTFFANWDALKQQFLLWNVSIIKPDKTSYDKATFLRWKVKFHNKKISEMALSKKNSIYFNRKLRIHLTLHAYYSSRRKKSSTLRVITLRREASNLRFILLFDFKPAVDRQPGFRGRDSWIRVFYKILISLNFESRKTQIFLLT